ncbi:hypothetical protein SSX86_021662 [Deinandra increscens subsp. villosa]|uniref:F-box domain-containing protein n=1 Tax=Deinandra increscens subsp. villosa TaxID=3103831 RepID=A0AAP0CR50_9ASTR
MSSSGGNNPPPLPLDIIKAILRLLPAKSLGRFKSVSKTWRSLISDPQFIKTHLHHQNHHKTKKLILLLTDDKSLHSVDITHQSLNSNHDLSAIGNRIFPSTRIQWTMGSCNGIVSSEDENGTVLLMNPTTKELWKVPPSRFTFPDPDSVIFLKHGFGYDSSTDDYKIVTIWFWKTGRKSSYKVSVYSLRNNSWKELRNYVYDNVITIQFTGVLVNQNLHWLMRSPNGDPLMIVAFRLGNEDFKEIKLPPDAASVEKVGIGGYEELFSVGGKLGFFGTGGLGLWVMEEYGVGESWTKVCTDGIGINPFEHFSFIEGINGDIVLHGEDRVVVYNLDERRRRNVRIQGGPTAGIGIDMGVTYFESLESPVKYASRN